MRFDVHREAPVLTLRGLHPAVPWGQLWQGREGPLWQHLPRAPHLRVRGTAPCRHRALCPPSACTPQVDWAPAGEPKLAASCAFNPPPSTHTNTHPTLQRFAVTGLEAGARFPGAARSAGRTGL